MKNTLKYSLIIIALLLIGFAIGFLVNGRLTNNRIKKMRSMNTEQGLNHEFKRILKPTPEQMAQLEPILKEFSERNNEMICEFRSNQKELFTELRAEVDPLLTEEQLDHMNCIKKRWATLPPLKRKKRPKSDSLK